MRIGDDDDDDDHDHDSGDDEDETCRTRCQSFVGDGRSEGLIGQE